MRNGSRRARATVAVLAASLALVAAIGPVSAARAPKGLTVSLADAGTYSIALGGCESKLSITYNSKLKINRFQVAGPLVNGDGFFGGGFIELGRDTGRILVDRLVIIQEGGGRVSVDAQLDGALQAFAYSNTVSCSP